MRIKSLANERKNPHTFTAQKTHNRENKRDGDPKWKNQDRRRKIIEMSGKLQQKRGFFLPDFAKVRFDRVDESLATLVSALCAALPISVAGAAARSNLEITAWLGNLKGP